MLVQGDRPVVTHAEQVVQEIGHPEDPTLLLGLDQVGLGHRRFRGTVKLVKAHQLHEPKRTAGAHPRGAMEGPHGLVRCDQNPCLDLFRVHRRVRVA